MGTEIVPLEQTVRCLFRPDGLVPNAPTLTSYALRPGNGARHARGVLFGWLCYWVVA
jgi:hypothetical protein